MAIRKQIILDSGVVGEYWLIREIAGRLRYDALLRMEIPSSNVVIDCYLTEQTRVGGRSSILSRNYSFEQIFKSISEAEQALILLEDFAGGEIIPGGTP